MERCTMFLDWKKHIVKVTILPKANCRFNAVPITLHKLFQKLGRENNSHLKTMTPPFSSF